MNTEGHMNDQRFSAVIPSTVDSELVWSEKSHWLVLFIAGAMNVCLKARDSQANH